MLLVSDNKSLDFDIVSYQYPSFKSSNEEFDYDANWLVCKVKYIENDFTETYTDPCLLTYELGEVIDALSKIIDGDKDGYISAFMEPYLRVSIAGAEDKVMIVVCFVYDTLDGIWKERKIASFVDMDRAKEILNELKSLCKKYPQR